MVDGVSKGMQPVSYLDEPEKLFLCQKEHDFKLPMDRQLPDSG